MSDLRPFVHGEEGTHSACNARLEAEGGKARCCYCRPHKGCDFGAPRAEEQDFIMTVDATKRVLAQSAEEAAPTVAIETVMANDEQRRAINSLKLDEIVWTWRGKPVEIPAVKLDEFLFTGLSNIDLILSDFLPPKIAVWFRKALPSDSQAAGAPAAPQPCYICGSTKHDYYGHIDGRSEPQQPKTDELDIQIAEILRQRDSKVLEFVQDKSPVALGPSTKSDIEAIHRLLRTERVSELEALVNMPGASHDDIYYAAVGRLHELKGENR